jgi:hypothetical protein
MNNRFIEIDSSHRDRTQFPLQSYFVIPFTYSSTIAKDPILTGGIYYSWTSDYHPTTLYPLKSGSTNSSPKLDVSNSHPQPSIENYYAGYVISVISNSITEMRVVNSYDPPNVSLTLSTAFSFADGHSIAKGDLYALFEMNTPSLIHLPIIDSNGIPVDDFSQAYDSYYVMDETLSYGTTIVARLVAEYDFTLRYCHLDEPFPSQWSHTDSYTLRRTLPLEKWKLSQPTTINNAGFMVVTLPNEANASNRYYVGKYIYFASNVTQGTGESIYGTYYIAEYDGFTRKAVCYSSNDSNNPIYPPSVNDTINIVSFQYDHYSPLLYNGSIVSQNQTVCYEISLVSLILPNVILETGSRIAFYPYVYVELSNVSSPSGMSRNIIYSNNPESGRALFIMAITDVITPSIGRFVKLLGKMRQTVKFKPNDALRFSVYLPDGKLYKTFRQDRFSPYQPNPDLQINAVFSIRRL